MLNISTLSSADDGRPFNYSRKANHIGKLKRGPAEFCGLIWLKRLVMAGRKCGGQLFCGRSWRSWKRSEDCLSGGHRACDHGLRGDGAGRGRRRQVDAARAAFETLREAMLAHLAAGGNPLSGLCPFAMAIILLKGSHGNRNFQNSCCRTNAKTFFSKLNDLSVNIWSISIVGVII